MSFKLTVIGAGSVGFTRGVVRDILCVPEFADTEFVFYDINPHNLDEVYQLVQRDIEASGLPAKLSATTDRREALAGAKYVYSFVRVGGLEAYANDVEIPMKYGVDQCIGDTMAPGGIMYAQRTIPVLLDLCKDISEVAAPGCLYLNYSNPMVMNTWACNKYGHGVKMVGLCHGVWHGHWQIAEVLGLPQQEVDVICAGINHQTWFVQVLHKGEDMTGKLLEGFEKHPDFSRTEKVRIDMLRRFGYYSTESNGHLSEYLPWYRKRPEEIAQWIDMTSGSVMGGESAGGLRATLEGRAWFEHDFSRWLEEPAWTFRPEDRGNEHGTYIIESLETGRVYRGHFNVVNHGRITNLPDDCIIEAPGYVDGNGLSVPYVGELPLGCAAVCNATISAQRLGVEAAVHGDDMLLRQAMMMDPLTGAVCNPPEIWQMTDELLVADAEWLPQFGPAIAAAKARLEAGPLLPTKDWQGAARLPGRTVEEMEAEAEKQRALAGESDKGKQRT
jgi:alpha-galactosidase